jgi:hypothetical protein
VPLDQDYRAVVGIDGSTKVRTERPGCGSALREVRAPEATTDRTLAAALSEKQVLLPPAFELDHPTLRIGEANPVQMLESQSCTPAASRPDVPGEHYRTHLAAPPGRRAAVLTHPEPLFPRRCASIVQSYESTPATVGPRAKFRVVQHRWSSLSSAHRGGILQCYRM